MNLIQKLDLDKNYFYIDTVIEEVNLTTCKNVYELFTIYKIFHLFNTRLNKNKNFIYEMEYIPLLNKLAKEKFVLENTKIDISYEKTSKFYLSLGKNGEKEFLLLVEFDFKELKIHILSSTSNISGTTILICLRNFIISMNNNSITDIKHCYVNDDSAIEYYYERIDLACLQILIYGSSWYNRRGYISETLSDEMVHNEKIRNKTYFELCELVEEQEPDNQLLRDILTNYLEICNVELGIGIYFYQLFNNLQSRYSTKIINNYIKQNVMNNNHDSTFLKIIEFFSNIIELIFINHIYYDRELEYDSNYDIFDE